MLTTIVQQSYAFVAKPTSHCNKTNRQTTKIAILFKEGAHHAVDFPTRQTIIPYFQSLNGFVGSHPLAKCLVLMPAHVVTCIAKNQFFYVSISSYTLAIPLPISIVRTVHVTVCVTFTDVNG
jgi:hypothetical protein